MVLCLKVRPLSLLLKSNHVKPVTHDFYLCTFFIDLIILIPWLPEVFLSLRDSLFRRSKREKTSGIQGIILKVTFIKNKSGIQLRGTVNNHKFKIKYYGL